MATKKAAKKAAKKSTTPPSKRWSAKVKTDSTKPGPGLFKKSAKKIATEMTSKKVAPEGPGQAMRMLNFYENRGGKNLSGERKNTLERAKDLVHQKVEQERGKTATKKSATKKSSAKKTATKKSAAKKSTRKSTAKS
jgi:hypothetical protein